MTRFNLQSRRARIGIALGAFGLYALVFFLFYPQFGDGGAALAILPVAVIAWLGGARLGLLAGLLSFPLNMLLLNLVAPRANTWGVIIQGGGGPGSMAIMLMGFVVGYLHDLREQLTRQLTQRQQAETALSESEQRYRTLFESTYRQAQELALLDRVRQALARELELPPIFRTVVEGIAQTFGYTQVSLYLQEGDVLVLQHQVGYDHVIERIPSTQGVSGQVVRSQQPVFLEDAHTEPAFLGAIEGITSEVCVPLFDQNQVVGILNVESTQGVKLSKGDMHLMIALGEQVSIALGRARLYSEVRESEQRFRQLAEHIEQIFWLEDPERSRFFYISPVYEAMWGRTRQSLYEQPQTWFDAIHPDDRDRVLAAQARKVSGEYQIEYRVIRPDGSLRWVWSRAFPIQDEHGQVYRIAGIAEDITERKAAEAELHDVNDQLALWLKELEQQTRQLALLNELHDLLQACRTPHEAYALIPRFGNQLFPDEAGALYILNLSRTFVERVGAWNLELGGDGAWALDHCRALRQGQLHIVDASAASTISQNPQVVVFCPHVQSPYPVASLCIPLMSQGEALGVLHLRSRDILRPNEPTATEAASRLFPLAKQQLVHTVADSLALALANLGLRETLREQAIRDALTGLFNRRYLEETLEREVKRVARGLLPLGIIMLDLDHFKTFNDTFGHAAGDALLQAVGAFLQSRVRGEDIACRYGGEEFTLVMPEAPLAVTRSRAEQLREDIKQLVVRYDNRLLGPITLSLGVASLPEHGQTREAVLQAADRALYQAKREGRDRVVVAE